MAGQVERGTGAALGHRPVEAVVEVVLPSSRMVCNYRASTMRTWSTWWRCRMSSRYSAVCATHSLTLWTAAVAYWVVLLFVFVCVCGGAQRTQRELALIGDRSRIANNELRKAQLTQKEITTNPTNSAYLPMGKCFRLATPSEVSCLALPYVHHHHHHHLMTATDYCPLPTAPAPPHA